MIVFDIRVRKEISKETHLKETTDKLTACSLQDLVQTFDECVEAAIQKNFSLFASYPFHLFFSFV